VIALIKPQFEVGKGEVGKGGIVTDRTKHKRVLIEIKGSAAVAGLTAVGLIESPILGAEGNREFLIHLKPSSAELTRLDVVEKQIDLLAGQIKSLLKRRAMT